MTETRVYSQHGLNALKQSVNSARGRRKVRLPLTNRVDRRSPMARWLVSLAAELVAELGGADSVTRQQREIVDIIVKTALFLNHIDGWLLQQSSLVLGRKQGVLPVLKERTRLADSLVRYLEVTGLERKAKPILDLTSYLAQAASSPTDEPAQARGQTDGPGASTAQRTTDECDPANADEPEEAK